MKETSKDIVLLFFENRENSFHIWEYKFYDKYDYNSIKLVRSSAQFHNSVI